MPTLCMPRLVLFRFCTFFSMLYLTCCLSIMLCVEILPHNVLSQEISIIHASFYLFAACFSCLWMYTVLQTG
uniref:Uncharacterized protein n=1 Tax=Arundo donax TaxID=35708 RepID=A0A0A9EKS8_ARUDO